MVAKKPQPTELITYFCSRCTWDFARSDLDAPTCTMCCKGDRLTEMKREPITPQAIEEGMMRSMDRLMTGLRGAYESGKKEGIADDDEILLLEAMVKAKNLQEHVEKTFGMRVNKRPRIHGISMSL